MELTKEQSVQEAQYDVPYHWFFKDDSYRGRVYFCYTKGAIAYAKKYGLTEAGSVLDAGCGDARFTRMLIESGFQKVSGLDYSEQAIRFARVFLPDTTFLTTDLTDEQFSVPEEFDGVFLIETLEHIDPNEVPLFLTNLSKCLKNNGTFVVTVPSTLLPLHDKHYQHFTPETLRETLGSSFEVLEVVGYDRVGNPFLSLLYKLLDNRLWDIKPLSRLFNTRVWAKHQGITKNPNKGRGLIAVCKKR